MLCRFPNIMSSTVIDGGTALERMSKFLQEPEIEEYVEPIQPAVPPADKPGPAVEVVDGSFVSPLTYVS